jgi:hypothetical protein
MRARLQMMLLASIFAWCMAGPLKCDLDKGAQHEQLQATFFDINQYATRKRRLS